MGRTPDEHTEAELEAIAAAVPPELRVRILALVDRLETMESVVTWRGGDVVDHTSDGQPILQMPWADQCDELSELERLLYDAQLVVPFDWSEWADRSGHAGGMPVRDLTIADAVRLITTFVRSDRFDEGQLAASVEDGRLPFAIRRALS